MWSTPDIGSQILDSNKLKTELVNLGHSADNSINDPPASRIMTGGNECTGGRVLRGPVVSSVCLWAGQPCCENCLLFIRLLSINRRGANARLNAPSTLKPPTQTIRPGSHLLLILSFRALSLSALLLFHIALPLLHVCIFIFARFLFPSPASGVEYLSWRAVVDYIMRY